MNRDSRASGPSPTWDRAAAGSPARTRAASSPSITRRTWSSITPHSSSRSPWAALMRFPSRMLISKAEYYSAQQLKITLGSAYEIPFPDAYFEGVFCCWLFEHLPDPERAIVEFHRVLKPGGLCSIVVPTPVDMVAFYADYTHIRPFTATSLRQLAAVANFAQVRTENLPWTRGMRQIYRRFGGQASYRYMLFADRYLRRLGIRNRDHLVLDAWK